MTLRDLALALSIFSLVLTGCGDDGGGSDDDAGDDSTDAVKLVELIEV